MFFVLFSGMETKWCVVFLEMDFECILSFTKMHELSDEI